MLLISIRQATGELSSSLIIVRLKIVLVAENWKAVIGK